MGTAEENMDGIVQNFHIKLNPLIDMELNLVHP